MKNLKYYLDKMVELSKDVFVEEMNYPFLVYMGEVDKKSNGDSGKKTESIDIDQLQELLFMDDASRLQMEIHPIVKKDTEECKGEISIGRGEDNDIMIILPLISRSHSVIKQDGEYYIKDLGSTNKTFLNWETLVPEKWTLLNEGDNIIFSGKYNFTFHAPDRLYDMLKVIKKQIDKR